MNDRELLELLLVKVTSVESDVGTLKSDFKKMSEKLEIIFTQTAKLSEYHTETAAKLNSIIEDQKSMQEVLGVHEVSIRTLRRKPV